MPVQSPFAPSGACGRVTSPIFRHKRTAVDAGMQYELPKKIEHYLAALSTLYARDGERMLQQIIVNPKTRVVEGSTSDMRVERSGNCRR
jgi:hypothetical protein